MKHHIVERCDGRMTRLSSVTDLSAVMDRIVNLQPPEFRHLRAVQGNTTERSLPPVQPITSFHCRYRDAVLIHATDRHPSKHGQDLDQSVTSRLGPDQVKP